MLIPDPVERLLNFPWHLTKGIAHISAWPVRAIMQTDDMPDTRPPKEGELTVYDVAEPMLDIASIIYYYTELRSETKKILMEFAEKFELSVKEIDVVRNAIANTKTKLEALKATNEADASVSGALASYQESMIQLENLKIRYKMTDGDVEVFATYFDILVEPKDAVKIKSDLILYNKFISPAFRKSFGGSEFNIDNIIKMVERDPTMYIKEIDDDFVTKSLAPSGFLNDLASELVYSIVVSPKSRRVTVVFRGSVNANDWITNVSMAMTDFKLPGFSSEEARYDRQSYGRVHRGFYEYLFGKTQKGDNGSYKSKAEEIMGILATLLEEECKGYSVFVTGHSLGGSMSTMFAFRAAAFGQVGMVTNVSFASPYCGDQGFRDSFYDLEKNNKIRHIRVSNDEDVVPLIPFAAPPLEMYKHTGMNVRMFNPDQILMPKCRLFYPKEGSWPNEVRNALLNNFPMGLSVGVISKHLCPEYSSRLEGSKEELKKVTVESLYERSDLTGWSYSAP